MLSKSIYINGLAGFNPWAEGTEKAESFTSNEPEYKEYLDSTSVRRLNRLIKMALVASKKCLSMAEIELPDAIITGTGFGCIEDTEKFLNSVLDNELTMLSPTSFIQSTHNTISGQIALMLKCYGYNNTFSHRWLSFEQALEDAIMLLEEETCSNVLVGAADEFTTRIHEIKKRLGLYSGISNHKALPTEGEGVHFFVLSNKVSRTTLAKVVDAKSFDNDIDIKSELQSFLKDSHIESSEIDAVILGNNGDSRYDHIYSELADSQFNHASRFQYKHKTGEYFTSVAFAWKVACELLKTQKPNSTLLFGKVRDKYQNILIYNQFQNSQHSFALLQHVQV